MIFYFNFELDNKFKELKEKINNYEKIFRNVCNSPIGTYTPHNMIETVEEFINLLENNYDFLQTWTKTFLDNYRDKLWLNYGLDLGKTHCDYWQIGKEDYSYLFKTWPFLFASHKNYKDFILDFKEAQYEVLRQRERQNTTNPNYTPFHPDGCSSRCSCWMLDDMEQWHEEEQKEIKESKNIFFNTNIQRDFFKEAEQDLPKLKEQWINWTPKKSEPRKYINDLEIKPGQTVINIVHNWIKRDFQHSTLIWMFGYNNCFDNIWDNIDVIPNFIDCQREKLKKLRNLL